MARTGTPPREKARVYRTGRPDRLSPLLFAVAALILCAGIGAVLWHEWQGTRPTAAEQAEADEIERADGGEEEIAAVTEEAADGKIVVAIDPGHGGVNPSVGGEDAGSLGSGLREADVTLKTATLVYDKLARDGRFAPMLTANGTEYLKPSRRAARAKAAGAQLLLSIHLNYDADSCVSGFECCPATPQLSTNADSLRFARLVAEKFGAMGMESNDTTVLSDPTFTVVQKCGCPAVLVEEGFITNAGDVALVATDAACEAAAQAYYECILTYFDLT